MGSCCSKEEPRGGGGKRGAFHSLDGETVQASSRALPGPDSNTPREPPPALSEPDGEPEGRLLKEQGGTSPTTFTSKLKEATTSSVSAVTALASSINREKEEGGDSGVSLRGLVGKEKEESLPTPSLHLPLQAFFGVPLQPVCKNCSRGDYSFVWQRNPHSLDDWLDVSSASTLPEPYNPTIDDLCCNLRIKFAPLASGGRGEHFSNIATVGIDHTSVKILISSLAPGRTTFAVAQQDATGKVVDWRVELDHAGFHLLTRKKKDFKKIETVKWTAAVSILPSPLDSRTFTIQHDRGGQTLSITGESRDNFILSFRSYHGMGTSDILEEMTGDMDFAKKWSKGKMGKLPKQALEQALFKGGSTQFPQRSLSPGYDQARSTLISLKLAGMEA